MKLKNIILTTLAAIALISCYTSSRISKFSSENIKLGIDKNLFIKRFGKPFNKEISYTQDNQEKEKLFYKEESQRRALLPARADTVALYRAVGAARDGVPAGDLRPLFAKLGARGAGKALVSLEALRELSLLEQRETPQGARWCLVPAAGKKDLASAPILRRLEAAQ